MIQWELSHVKKIKDRDTTKVLVKDSVPVIEYQHKDMPDWVINGFSTRVGGVSEGIYEEMNLSFTQGDEDAAVRENFHIFGKALGIEVTDMVYSHQTHTTNVMRVTKDEKGMGILRERNFSDIDGLVTNEPGVCLVTSYADCVPLYFVDVKNKAIGLSHSGWRGTVGNICKNTIMLMEKEFGSRPEDILGFIGPSICQDCYEVSEDVAERFLEAYCSAQAEDMLINKGNGKYLLDLHKANYYNMVNCGLKEENVLMPDICTCCNATWLHSHRASAGKRGGLCAFLCIKY